MTTHEPPAALGDFVMYEQRYGLARRPFPPTPDTALYYPASGHEAALAALRRGLADDEGLLLVTGAPGMGKTLVGYALIERLPDHYDSAFLTHSWLADRTALLQALLYDLGLPYEGAGEQVLRLRLMDSVLEACSAGRRTLLVIDEAQYLGVELLEELRLLGNLEAGTGRAVQVVLLAQPALTALLARPEMAALRQRLAVRVELGPLGVEESFDYLLHHLRLAGGEVEKIFDEAALEVVARAAQGIPRLLNQAAHQALLLAEAAELARVDAEAALEGLTLLGLSGEGEVEAADMPLRVVGEAERRTA
jgi:type II secretory pathway predicted ATPase ExeA